MVAAFADLTLVHDNDLIAILDGGQAVSHDDGGTALHQLVQRILDQRFGLCVDVGGSFVQNQHGRLECQGTCKGQQLTLTGREGCAALDDLMIIAAIQLLDKAVGVDVFGSFHHICIADAFFAQTDVALDIAGKEEHILQHLANVTAQVSNLNVPDIHAIYQHLTLLHVIVSADQVLDGGLTGTGGTDKGHALAGLHLEGYVAQHPLFVTISEPNILELDLATERGHGHGVGLVLNLGLRVQQPENTLGRCRSRLDHVELFCQVLDGLEELGDVALENHQRTDGDNAIHCQASAVQQQDRHGHSVQHVGNGRIQSKRSQLLDVDLAQLLGFLCESLHRVIFCSKDLHGLHAGDVLGHKAVQLRDLCTDVPINLFGIDPESKGCYGDHRQHRKDHQRQLCMHGDHIDHDAGQQANALQHVDDNAGEHFVHRLTVVGNAGHQTADGVIIKEAHMQFA